MWCNAAALATVSYGDADNWAGQGLINLALKGLLSLVHR